MVGLLIKFCQMASGVLLSVLVLFSKGLFHCSESIVDEGEIKIHHLL